MTVDDRRLGAIAVVLLALLVVMVAAIGAKTFGLALPADPTPVPWLTRLVACEIALREQSGRAVGNRDYKAFCGTGGRGLPPEDPRDWPKDMLPIPDHQTIVWNCYQRIEEDPSNDPANVDPANVEWYKAYACDRDWPLLPNAMP